VSRFRDGFPEGRDVAEPVHEPAECADPYCELYGCRMFREGWQHCWPVAFDDGYAAGMADGWDAGFDAGVQASKAG
jgi:hypothetical protein